MSNKHWYNNGTNEICCLECPEGYIKGRLPISEETRQKHINNNGMHNMTDEQKKARAEKIHQYNLNKTEEQIKHKSEAISLAKKGKYKGKEPWNKGKKGVQQAWNKGKKVPLSEESKDNMLRKQYQTKKSHNSFNSSSAEAQLKILLENKFGKNDISYQYTDERYPFACDFYIKSLDLFIELNLTWTHGGHPFNENNPEDLQLLEYWKEKAVTSDYYKNAIYTWTDLDVRKQKIAKENNLNYITIYNTEELDK